jgi:SAM-dependent methyltransferase
MHRLPQIEIERLKKMGWTVPKISPEGFYVPREVDESNISFPSASWEIADSHEDATSFWATQRANLIYGMLQMYNIKTLWEIGAGNGTSAIPLRELGLEVLAVEPLKSGATVLQANNFNVFYATLEDLRLPEGSIEAIGAFDVLEHLEDPKILLNEIFRVLKPGGIFICSVPANQWLFSDFDVSIGHFRRYSRRSLSKIIVDSKLTVLKIENLFGFLVIPAFILRRIPFLLGRRRKLKKIDASRQKYNWILSKLNLIFKILVWVERNIRLRSGLSLILISSKLPN